MFAGSDIFNKSIVHCVCRAGRDYSLWCFERAKQTGAILYALRNERCLDQQRCLKKKKKKLTHKHFSFRTAKFFFFFFSRLSFTALRAAWRGSVCDSVTFYGPLGSTFKSQSKALLTTAITSHTKDKFMRTPTQTLLWKRCSFHTYGLDWIHFMQHEFKVALWHSW